MTRPAYSPQAKIDLIDIGSYIARDSPRRALSYVQELRAQCRKIAQSPQAYRLRSELGKNIRSCAYGNFIIIFFEDGQSVQIVRVLHGAMDIEAQFGENDDPH